MSLSESALQKAHKYELLDPDVRLMLQVRDGSASAFEELVDKYQARLVGILGHMISNRDLAEDLAQEVFMRVYRARERYVPGQSFRRGCLRLRIMLPAMRFGRSLVARKSI